MKSRRSSAAMALDQPAIFLVACCLLRTGMGGPLSLPNTVLLEGIAAQPAHAHLPDLTASEAVQLLCSRRVTAVQYNAALLARIRQWECINAFAHINATKVLVDSAAVDARAAAGQDVGPLCGLGFAVKDNIDVAGYPTVAGTPALHGMRPEANSPVVERLLAANGVVLGKTAMHELAAGPTSINPHYGPVLNPYNNTMHPGGSSGGTGAIIAARGAPAGFCSDTGGSCRIPGSLTGTVGFRPSMGCYNAGDGIVPMSTTRDTVGIMARTVDDVILFDKLFSDCGNQYGPVDLRGLRLGYPIQYWQPQDMDSEIVPVLDAAVKALEAAGAVIVPFDMGLLLRVANKLNPADLNLAYEMPRELSRYLWSHRYNISISHLTQQIASVGTRLRMERATHFSIADPEHSPAAYARMLAEGRPKVREMFEGYFDAFGFDIMIYGTTQLPARRIDETEPYTNVNGNWLDTTLALAQRTYLDSAAGIPGISIPAGLTASGLPIGLQLNARTGQDGLLLSAGSAVQAALPATPPPPPPACAGCAPRLSLQEVTFRGTTAAPRPGESASVYRLEYEGSCRLLEERRAGQQCSDSETARPCES